MPFPSLYYDLAFCLLCFLSFISNLNYFISFFSSPFSSFASLSQQLIGLPYILDSFFYIFLPSNFLPDKLYSPLLSRPLSLFLHAKACLLPFSLSSSARFFSLYLLQQPASYSLLFLLYSIPYALICSPSPSFIIRQSHFSVPGLSSVFVLFPAIFLI
ncbi:unnamed protein product [Acanthosepion pharaonis]|uniref:Uncharacterized protein n=1 Tax=Acanthosepion pharaonis TaxID=158019 RepID=A0A812D9P7_ACAPH|nr:unnamed protein product [Sepia pharaonis]